MGNSQATALPRPSRAWSADLSRNRTALVVVDVQNDYLPGGVMAVPDGDRVVPVVNRLRKGLELDVVALTQDWHPPSYATFATNNPDMAPFDTMEDDEGCEVLVVPDHCVQGTPGADFPPELVREVGSETIVRKGTGTFVTSHSAFFDLGRQRKTDLEQSLKEARVSRVLICGLPMDGTVLHTALDAIELGFETVVIEDATRGIKRDNVKRAKESIKEAGGKVVMSSTLLRGVTL